MKQSLKDFLEYGLNKVDESDEHYKLGERYIGNYASQYDGVYFYKKKEAKEKYNQDKKEEIEGLRPVIGRPKNGKEKKVVVSIRLEPRIKAYLIARYGSIQIYIDVCLSNDKYIK